MIFILCALSRSLSLSGSQSETPSLPNGTRIRGSPPSNDLLPFPRRRRRVQPAPVWPTCVTRTACPGCHECGPAPAPPSSGCRYLGLHLRRSGWGRRRVPRRPARYAALPPGSSWGHFTCCSHLCFITAGAEDSGDCYLFSSRLHCREMWLGRWQNSTRQLRWIHGRSNVRAPNLCFCLRCACLSVSLCQLSCIHYIAVAAANALLLL